MIELIKNTDYTITKDLWAYFRNKGDKYIIEFQYIEDGEKIKTRRTTNKLVRFKNYLDKSFPNWQWMNIYFRWADLEKGQLKKAQIAAYSKNYPPQTDNPTKRDLSNFLNFQKQGFGYDQTLIGIKAYKQLVLDKIELFETE